jgi:excisionase family DNA binding protein
MQKKINKPVVFSALEVANICGVVNQTAINWIRNGHLKAFSTPGGQYRIYADDLVEFMSGKGMRVPESLYDGVVVDRADIRSILVVDDNQGLNAVITKYLEKAFADFSIYQSFDIFDTGVKTAEYRPGFIILDFDILGINGESILRRLKETEDFGKPFVIVISSLGDDDVRSDEIRSSIMEMKADRVFKKPITLKDISDTIEEFSKQ